MTLRRAASLLLIGWLLLAALPGAWAQASSPLAAGPASPAVLAGTGFTYQGRLTDGDGPVTDECDFEFSLYVAPVLGAQEGDTQTLTVVSVSAGLFTVTLNAGGEFGPDAFDGSARWLNIAVRCPAGAGGYTTLVPRQPLTAVPLALALPGMRTEFSDGSWPNVVGGALSNSTSGGVEGAAIGGGENNSVIDLLGTVSGGRDNEAGYAAAVGGGQGNSASGEYAVVPGGIDNDADGEASFAAGTGANAEHAGAFVWADTANAPFASTAANQFLVRANGGVGLGTNAPLGQLHVVGTVSGDALLANHVAIVENNSGVSSPDVLALRTSGITTPTNINNFITFFGAGAGTLGSIEGNGAGGVTMSGPGNDFAEYLPLADPAETLHPGDVVGVFAGRVTRRTEGADLVLVLSTAPIISGNRPASGSTEGMALAALVGQAPVRVLGEARPGDFIVPSGLNDGTGRSVAAEDLTPALARQVVGQALSAATGVGEHAVMALVGLPRDAAWAALLEQKDAALAERVAALEAGETAHRTVFTSALPWLPWFLVAGLGLLNVGAGVGFFIARRASPRRS